MKAPKSVFVCTECEYTSPKWLGKCPSCGSWNTLEEQAPLPPAAAARERGTVGGGGSAPPTTKNCTALPRLCRYHE